MIYEYLKGIDHVNRFTYIAIVIGFIVFFKRLELSSHIIFGLIIGIITVWYFNEKTNVTNTGFIAQMRKILATPALKPHLYKNLYKDSELVILLDDYKEYHYYNPATYQTVVQGIDQFLGLTDMIQHSTEYQNDYELLRELKIGLLNKFHEFIYRVPNAQAALAKYQNGLLRLEKHLNYHIDKAHRTVSQRDQEEGISIKSKFPHRNHPRHYDASWKDRHEYFS
jgi:hypothetical protein